MLRTLLTAATLALSLAAAQSASASLTANGLGANGWTNGVMNGTAIDGMRIIAVELPREARTAD